MRRATLVTEKLVLFMSLTGPFPSSIVGQMPVLARRECMALNALYPMGSVICPLTNQKVCPGS